MIRHKLPLTTLISEIPQTQILQICKYLNKDEKLNGLKMHLKNNYIEIQTNDAFNLFETLSKANITLENMLDAFEKLEYAPPLLMFKDLNPVKIAKQPERKIKINVGQTLKLSCHADGYPLPKYQWFKEKNLLFRQTQAELVIENIKIENQGLYICRVNNAGIKNALYSNWSAVKVCSPKTTQPIVQPKSKGQTPRIIKHPIANLNITEMDTLTLTCNAIGLPNLSFQWYKDHVVLEDYTFPTLTMTNCRKAVHEGVYQCKVLNDFGVVWTCQSQVNIKMKDDKIDSTPQTIGNLCLVHNNLSVKPLQINPNSVSGRKPYITYHPQVPSLKLRIGSSIILACKAKGDTPLSYEWYKNNTIVPNLTSNELRFVNLQESVDTGVYQCRVSNPFGSVLSKPAEIVLDLDSNSNYQLTATDKIALLIGNYNYMPNHSSLGTVANDIGELSQNLKDLGFEIYAYTNLTYESMVKAITDFTLVIAHCIAKSIRSRVYIVFYFGGHGFEKNGESYLVPIYDNDNKNKKKFEHLENAILEKNSLIQLTDNCLRTDENKRQQKCICVERDILKVFNNVGSRLLVKQNHQHNAYPTKYPECITFILDICRLEEQNEDLFITNVLNEENDVANKTFVPSNNPSSHGNCIFGYATSSSAKAYELEGHTHSIYMTHLLKHIQSDSPIEDILKRVRLSVYASEPLAQLNNQFPEIRSNLSKNFSLADKIWEDTDENEQILGKNI